MNQTHVRSAFLVKECRRLSTDWLTPASRDARILRFAPEASDISIPADQGLKAFMGAGVEPLVASIKRANPIARFKRETWIYKVAGPAFYLSRFSTALRKRLRPSMPAHHQFIAAGDSIGELHESFAIET
jgi:hypothetical protein